MTTIDRNPVEFETTFPVVVIGAGAAGLTAALAAADAGAEVLLLERDETPRGSTSMSQGNVCAVNTRLQREAGIEDSPEAFYRDTMARTRGTADPDLTMVIANQSGPAIDWLVDKHDIPFRVNLTWGGFFGHSVNRIHGVPAMSGEQLLGALMRAAEAAGVTLLPGAHVTTLHADADDRVTGVTFMRRDGGSETVGAGAVILATCGFGANEEMVREYIPDFGRSPAYRYFGHEGNKGEGIQWGKDLGAALGSMDAFQGYGALADPYGVILNYDAVMGGGIAVNINGERFSNEVKDISAQSLNVLAQPGGIGWFIFDDARRDIVADMPEYIELDRMGAFRRADTPEALGELIDVPKDALLRTLDDNRRMAKGEIACPFGRDFTGVGALSGPLTAVKTTGALFHTQGGLKIDGNARVVRESGAPLPNLYACGGTAQGIAGTGCDGYLPAAGLCMAVTLGMVAGRDAAAALVEAA
ncbi:FAD-dependent oxidoreductase (plasmid) [Sulfitobacter sp. LCG007]